MSLFKRFELSRKKISQFDVVVVVWWSRFGGVSFLNVKEAPQVAGETISPNNRFDVYCGWYCRGVWQRKVDIAKVARNAPELGALGQ